MQTVGVLCGGSGSSKFVSAISNYSGDDVEPRFIGNVGDNFWYHGILVCPDIDIITYSLAGLLDTAKGWGIQNDSFVGKEMLSRLSGTQEWFSLGDRDLAVCLKRTEYYQKGWTLSSITKEICTRLGARRSLTPATDDPVQTFVRTVLGNLHLQEFWVKNGGKLDAFGVQYVGIKKATPTQEFLDVCKNPVIICPANPVSSILPSIRLKGIISRLKKSRVVAISPFVGGRPFSGPAANLMRALNIETSSRGVAKLYSDFLKVIFLDKEEEPGIVSSIRDMGVECVLTNTRIESVDDKKKITAELLAAL